MTLPIEILPTIIGRGGINISLYIPDPDKLEETQSGELSVQIKRSDGIKVREFDLLDRLLDDSDGTSIHLPALVALRDYIVARVVAEMLP